MDTVVKKELKPTKLNLKGGLSDENVTFEVYGMNVERSFEDREVYFEAFEGHTWLRAEDAIRLGQTLIEHGTNALMANMINHQLIHAYNTLKRFHSEERFENVTLTVVDENPANYGGSYRTYKVAPNWLEGKVPEFYEDFSFETIISWSPFEDEYKQQLEQWWNPIIQGYDREAELEAFQKALDEFEEEQETPVEE
jgi:hypothetical protein